MVEAENARGGRLLAWPKLKLIVVLVLVLFVAGFVGLQVAFLWTQPITHGSVSWSTGLLGECPGFRPTAETSECATVPFDPGAPVSFGFTVRNTGPLPLTVVSVGGFGTEFPHFPAEMHPVLPPQVWPSVAFPMDDARPFEPITIRPGDEALLQLLGNMRDCDVVRDHWSPGYAVGTDSVHLRVRWLLLTRNVEIPLQRAFYVQDPAAGQCA